MFNSYEAQQALGLLAAAGGRSDGANFGQRMIEGLGQGERWKQQQAAEKRAQMQDQMQQIQMQEYLNKAQEAKAQKAAMAAKQSALPGLFRAPSNGAPALSFDSLVPAELRTGMAPQAAIAPQQGGVDVQRALAAGYSPEEITKLDALRNIGMNEVARTIDVEGANGGKTVRGLDKFGRQVFDENGYVAPVSVNQGNQTTFVKPSAGLSLPMGMSPSERDASARGWANNTMARDRLNFDQTQNGGQGKAPAGYKWNADGTALEAIPGGPAAGSKLTESEGKSTLYLSQMRDATKAINTLGDNVSPMMVAATGSPYTNWLAGENSQKAGQAQRQWAEAFLREKTGAAATAGEVENNIRTFFPVVGDSPEVVAQKKSARENAEKTMEIPAGRGASRIPAGEQPAPAAKNPNLVNDLPKNAKVGARARDTTTGQIMRFDGMKWKPE